MPVRQTIRLRLCPAAYWPDGSLRKEFTRAETGHQLLVPTLRYRDGAPQGALCCTGTRQADRSRRIAGLEGPNLNAFPALNDRSPMGDAPSADRWRGSEEPAALRTEWVDILMLARHVRAWKDLCVRALEPNIFLDPDFALPLFQHARPPREPRFLLVWAENGPANFGRLLGLFAIDRPRWPGGLTRSCLHDQTSSGMPLVDRDRSPEVIAAALARLGTGDRRSAALILPSVIRDGPFAAAVRQVCETSSRALVVLEERSRAVLPRPAHGDDRIACFASARRRKQHARKARRLAEAGTRTLTSARTPSEVAVATERFLELEYRSWKGARGTALLSNPALATFARTMTRLLSVDGRCRIDALEIDGRPIAIGIVLSDDDRAYFWKIAFDEAFGAFSPGVQLALDVTQTQLADASVELTDSCAEPDNPMIDRLWPDRITMVDLLVGVPAGRRRWHFQALLAVERSRRALRHRAKMIYLRLRRRRID